MQGVRLTWDGRLELPEQAWPSSELRFAYCTRVNLQMRRDAPHLNAFAGIGPNWK